MYQRILVPTDGSDLSALAEDAAIAFARACGSELVVLSIVPPDRALTLDQGAMAREGLAADGLLAQAKAYVGRVADAAAKVGVKSILLTGSSYSVASEIIEAVTREHCDLVFMASHGRGGLSRLIAGSVPQQVLAYSTAPVLVYRPKPAKAFDELLR